MAEAKQNVFAQFTSVFMVLGAVVWNGRAHPFLVELSSFVAEKRALCTVHGSRLKNDRDRQENRVFFFFLLLKNGKTFGQEAVSWHRKNTRTTSAAVYCVE